MNIPKWLLKIKVKNLSKKRDVQGLINILDKEHSYWPVQNALSELGETALMSLIIAIKDNKNNEDIVRNACCILGSLRNKRAVDPLIAVLNDVKRDYHTRSAACESLGAIGDMRAFQPLYNVRISSKNEEYLREEAKRACDRLNKTRKREDEARKKEKERIIAEKRKEYKKIRDGGEKICIWCGERSELWKNTVCLKCTSVLVDDMDKVIILIDRDDPTVPRVVYKALFNRMRSYSIEARLSYFKKLAGKIPRTEEIFKNIITELKETLKSEEKLMDHHDYFAVAGESVSYIRGVLAQLESRDW